MKNPLKENDIPDLNARLTALASRLAQFGAENREEAAIQAHMVAALYALRRAFAWQTAGGTPPSGTPCEELCRVALELRDGETTGEGPWLAEFYLAAAEHRLSLIPPKLKRYRKVGPQSAPPRYRQVKMGTQTGRIEEMTSAIARLEEFLDILLPE